MKKLGFSILGILLLLCIVVIVIGPQKIFLMALSPSHGFETEIHAPVPDYSNASNWAALPTTKDPSDLSPKGVAKDATLNDVNVFFIHPTGYLKGDKWNFDMNPNTSTEENTKWMMANQASAFSDCSVYAPRYRQATIYSFFELEDEESDGSEALEFAYADVERAFDYFIEKYNQDQPFILASHSQGSYHGINLLKERIDGTPLAEKLIAAYLVGMTTISDKAVSEMSIPICDGPTQTGCLIHWATYGENAPPDEYIKEKMVCVNPLNWRKDGEREEKDKHLGYVPTAGTYNLKFYGDDTPTNVSIDEMPPPQKAYTFAYCKEGKLYVDQQSRKSEFLGKGNYHGLDYLLFHMDIRNNVAQRINTYRQENPVVSDDLVMQ